MPIPRHVVLASSLVLVAVWTAGRDWSGPDRPEERVRTPVTTAEGAAKASRSRASAATTTNAPSRARIETDLAAVLVSLTPGHDEDEFQLIASELARCGDRSWVNGVVNAVGDREIAAYFLNRVATEWAKIDPSGATAWLATLPPEAPTREAAISAYRVWSETEPRRAAENALRLTSADARQRAVRTVMDTWIQRDAPAASAWFAQLEPDPDLDPVVTQIARAPAFLERHPEVALTWAESIGNAAQRLQTFELVFSAWNQRDHSAALDYLEHASSLTREERSQLREALNL